MKRGAIQLGIETIIIVALAIIILVIVMGFFYTQFVGPSTGLQNYTRDVNVTIPDLL